MLLHFMAICSAVLESSLDRPGLTGVIRSLIIIPRHGHSVSTGFLINYVSKLQSTLSVYSVLPATLGGLHNAEGVGEVTGIPGSDLKQSGADDLQVASRLPHHMVVGLEVIVLT